MKIICFLFVILLVNLCVVGNVIGVILVDEGMLFFEFNFVFEVIVLENLR